MDNTDIEFLKDLQHKMLTQNTCSQANPRLWVVRHTSRIYGIDSEYDYDGSEIIHEGEKIGETLKDLYDFLNNSEDLQIEYLDEGWRDIVIIDDDYKMEFEGVSELIQYMINELDYQDLYLMNYREQDVLAEDTFFLTLEECEKHIKNNKCHYNDPYPYAMTAWRSPQVERLYKILENTNWDSVSN